MHSYKMVSRMVCRYRKFNTAKFVFLYSYGKNTLTYLRNSKVCGIQNRPKSSVSVFFESTAYRLRNILPAIVDSLRDVFHYYGPGV